MARYVQWTVAQLIEALKTIPPDTVYDVRLSDTDDFSIPMPPPVEHSPGGSDGGIRVKEKPKAKTHAVGF